MKKITILALHLSTGGVENAIATLSNLLAEKYEVEIISTYRIEENPAFAIDNRVQIHYLIPDMKPNAKEFKQALKQFHFIKIFQEGIKALKILYCKRKYMITEIKQLSCDIAISTRDIHNKWLGKYGDKKIIKIAQEHNNNGNTRYIKRVLKSIQQMDYFMPVSQQLTDFYQEKLKETNVRCVYIPHCIKNYPAQISELDTKIILSVGRLSSEKGFLDLIDVFELVHEQYPDWHLNIVGDGEERQKIDKKIRDNKLEDDITLFGFKTEEELVPIFLKSSIYVMTSFHESFGLVLLEAESYGLPILAFDSAQGAKEIIQDKENGYLISNRNQEEMANQIKKLIQQKELRSQLGQVGRKLSQQYKKENIANLWYEFIEKIGK